MRRKLANGFALLSLLLFVAAAGFWIRSYFRGDYVSYHTAGGDRLSVSSTNGTLLAERQSNVVYHGDGVPPNGVAYKELDPARYKDRKWSTTAQWRFAGFGLVTNKGTIAAPRKSARPGAWQNTVVLVPHWAFLVLFAIPVGLRIRPEMRAWRSARGQLCPTCGYDLRATPERCPECGTAAVTRRPAAA